MKHRVLIENMQDKEPFLRETQNLITVVVNRALGFMDIEHKCEISVILVDDKEIQKLNKEHRNIDRSTDVLSFPQYEQYELDYMPENECVLLGDIVLSLEHARAQSIEFGHSYTRELAFLCAHSVLHLLGYDHMNDEDDKVMRTLQSAILENMGIIR